MIEKLIENWLINVHELGYTIPFCEVLISRGYTIVRISRQGRGELGKDVIARSREGELHTFQLKGPKDITLYEWQHIQDEVRDLVQLPAIDPAINRAEPHVPFLVTNGEIAGDALYVAQFEDRLPRERFALFLEKLVNRAAVTGRGRNAKRAIESLVLMGGYVFGTIRACREAPMRLGRW